mmetsp:Transcript_15010/g.21242  ORF Transcript_15010/g.21242 Transcript_15010/m.21242 type:complete len:339 (-) Transcript_15010:339-1355(-)
MGMIPDTFDSTVLIVFDGIALISSTVLVTFFLVVSTVSSTFFSTASATRPGVAFTSATTSDVFFFVASATLEGIAAISSAVCLAFFFVASATLLGTALTSETASSTLFFTALAALPGAALTSSTALVAALLAAPVIAFPIALVALPRVLRIIDPASLSPLAPTKAPVPKTTLKATGGTTGGISIDIAPGIDSVSVGKSLSNAAPPSAAPITAPPTALTKASPVRAALIAWSSFLWTAAALAIISFSNASASISPEPNFSIATLVSSSGTLPSFNTSFKFNVGRPPAFSAATSSAFCAASNAASASAVTSSMFRISFSGFLLLSSSPTIASPPTNDGRL